MMENCNTAWGAASRKASYKHSLDTMNNRFMILCVSRVRKKSRKMIKFLSGKKFNYNDA